LASNLRLAEPRVNRGLDANVTNRIEVAIAAAAPAIADAPERRSLAAAFALPYLLAAIALVALVHFGGVWNVLANTRVLDLLGRGGIIAITDADAGFIQGLPSSDYYVASQEAIDWELVLLAMGLFVFMWGALAIQFHGIAQFVGIQGTLGQHARAWFYGHGVNRILPYDAGKVATASVLEGQGAAPDKAAQAVFVGSLFVVFQVAVIAVYALTQVGFGTWVSELFWAAVILLVAYLMVRPDRRDAAAARRQTRRDAAQAVRALAREPARAAWLAVLGIGSILLLDAAIYALSQAFTTTIVVLSIEGSTLLMGVVAGYVARLIQFTPGGLGQWEWGFASALYAGGLGFPEAATVALLVTAVRYVVGGLLLAVVTGTYGVESSLRSVLRLFRGPTGDPAR
jgi:uncharacterized membrane protein YbhN (UPF0104 family)